jgi:tetratricopeptide (TPR) repeat protein
VSKHVGRACLVAAALVVVGCARSAANHESLGDRAYVAGEFAEALTEYRLAILQEQGPAARLRGKAAAAALKAGDLVGAAQEYGMLARSGGQRIDEVADGIERVARRAAEDGDLAALRASVTLMRELGTGRSARPFAAELVKAAEGASDAVAILPIAAANAPDVGQQDSLMFVYAQALARIGRCDQAVTVFEGLARRARIPMASGAPAAAALCALRVARDNLEAGHTDPAEQWFRRAVTLGEGSVAGRAAYLGLGDVLKARGDFAGAAVAWERVIADAAPGDSLAERARERLNAIANPGTVIP